jgi:hypothetical protein
MAAVAAVIVKTMSISRVELAASLATINPDAHLAADGTATFRIGEHRVRLHFEALPERRLGGLLAMPQARVTLDMANVPDDARATVLRAFEIAFQRGGG